MMQRGLDMIFDAALVRNLTITALIGLTNPVIANPQATDQYAAHYKDQSIVRVRTTSEAQLNFVLSQADDIWSERVGIGPLEIMIPQSRLENLTHAGIPWDNLITDLQSHVEQSQQEMRSIREAQSRSKPEGFQRGGMVHDDEWFATYRNLEEIQNYTQNIVNLRPDLAQIQVIGQSWEGRDMHSITISAPDSAENPREQRRAIYLFSTVHAREWIAPMTTTYMASKLAEDYDNDLQIRMMLDELRVIIVPIGNPDGYLYTWSDERFWRNTRRINSNGTIGVNINRNWGYEWGNQGSSSDPSNTNYRGTHPFSEPETEALRDVALNLGDLLVADIEYHSYSQLMIRPWGYSENAVLHEPFQSHLHDIGSQMADRIFDHTGEIYESIPGIELYTAAGASKDWFFGVLNRPSYTIELRPAYADFSPPDSEIFPCASENYEALKVFIEQTAFANRLLHEEEPLRDVLDERIVRLMAFTGSDEQIGSTLALHARIGTDSEFEQFPMEYEDSRLYSGLLPEGECGEVIQYYFSAVLANGEHITVPENGASTPYQSIYTSQAQYFLDPMEVDTGWISNPDGDTATSGFWEVAAPQPGSHHPPADNSIDGTKCWITDARTPTAEDDFDVDNGYATLISPRFSATPGSTISFWYWHIPSPERQDIARLRISNDDGQSSIIASGLRDSFESQWKRVELNIDDIIEPTESMRLIFQIYDNRTDSTVELAIDDLSIGLPGCPINRADLNADASLNFHDISLFIQFFQAESASADFTSDGSVNFFDIAEFLKIFQQG